MTPKTRNRCKKCRFKKCLSAGMSVNGIKMGRIPKLVKFKAIQSLKTSSLDDILTNSVEAIKTLCESNINCENDSNHANFNGYDESNGFYAHNNNENSNSVGDYSFNSRHFSSNDYNNNRNSSSDSSSDFNKSIPRPNNSIQNSSNGFGLARRSNDSKLKVGINKTITFPIDCMTEFLNKLDANNVHLYEETYKDNLINENLFNTHTKSITNGSHHNNSIELFSFLNLLNTQNPLHSLSLTPKTFYFDLFLNSKLYDLSDNTHHIICSILNDKIYQLFLEHTKFVNAQYEMIKKPASLNQDVFPNSKDFNLKQIWEIVRATLDDFVKTVISFVKEVPGLNELNEHDFEIVLNRGLNDFFLITNSQLMMNGESYILLDFRVQYKRFWMNKIIGKEKVDSYFEFSEFFNKINMTLKEKGKLKIK